MTTFDEDFSNKTVLIVEDNENSDSYFRAALHKYGVNTLSARNGIEAIRMFGENKQINLVLMDLNMPEMDGFEATRKIKSMRPEVPVVAQSAYILTGEEARSINAGCDEFLAKPIRLTSLVAVLKKYLE